MAGDRKIQLGIEIEQAQQQKVLSSIDAIRKNLATIGGEAAKESQAVKALGERFKELERSSAINNVVKQFADLSSSEEQAIKNANKLRETLKQVGATKDEIKEAVRAFHELSVAKVDAQAPVASSGGKGGLNIEGLRRTGGALSQLGLGEIGGIVSRAGDVGQVAKEFGLLSTSLEATGTASAAASTGIAGLAASLGPVLAIAAPVGVALFAASKAIEAFDKQTEMLTGDLGARVRTLDTYIKATTGTSSQRLGALGQNQEDVSALNRKRDELQKIVDSTFNELQKKEGDFGARIRLSRDKDYNDAIAEIEKLNKQITDLQRTSNSAFVELQSGKAAFLDLGEAAKEASAAITKATLAKADETKQTILEQAQLRSLSTDAAKQRLDSLKDEQASLQGAIKVIKDSGDTSKEASDKVKEYEAQLKKNADAQKYLTEIAMPLIKAREDEAAAVKALNAEADKRRAKIEAEIAQTAAQDKSRNDAIVARYDQYEKEIKQVQEQGQQAQTEAAKKYQDNLVNIAKKAADDSKAALARLIDQQKQLRTSYARDEAKETRKQQLDDLQTQIKAQREEAKAFEDHQQKLIQIRKSSELEEQDLLLNRNYRGLFQLRQKTAASMEDENSSFARGQQERQQTAQQEQQDITRQRQFERNERLIAYQQANADAQAKYQQELVLAQQAKIEALNQARIAYNKDLDSLRQKLNTELQLKRTAAQQDLAIINRTEQEKLAAYVNSLQAAQRFANLAARSGVNEGPNAGNPITTVSNGVTIKRYAAGGIMQAGQRGQVNEPGSSGRETFTANGRTIAFPGMGTFYPSQSGVVNANNNSPISLTFNVTESQNAQATAQAIKPIVLSVLNDVSGRRGA